MMSLVLKMELLGKPDLVLELSPAPKGQPTHTHTSLWVAFNKFIFELISTECTYSQGTVQTWIRMKSLYPIGNKSPIFREGWLGHNLYISGISYFEKLL